jgi:stringent starvation protein B
MSKARSRRPYLVRAIYDWASDNDLTPHLLVAADYPGVRVPKSYVQEGRITLNLSTTAVANLNLLPDRIWFSARFGGRAVEVDVPYGAVLAIFARENGEGVVFGEVEHPDPADPDPTTDQPSPSSPTHPDDAGKAKRAHLRVVK